MLIRKPADIPSSEITPESVYLDRRRFLSLGAAGAIGGAMLPSALSAACTADAGASDAAAEQQQEKQNSFEDITTYNNFYEFGTDKSDPAENAPKYLKPRPWTVSIEGLCAKPGKYGLEDFLKPAKIEDRVYRLRCVEAWSMVIPWRGISLADVIKRAQPTAAAKYVEFTTLLDPAQMPYQKTSVLDWPYIEGLRMDEAMHPLAMLATGLYGRDLPAQNGAPLRLVVPWKYGFKSIKSIVKIKFVDKQPTSSWMVANAGEYGFYSNVNPTVDHPRWSQATERRIGELRRRPTLMFNGYPEVASLYTGMDLKKYY
jgi:methionine sulfoxide reductase catalytic subunit